MHLRFEISQKLSHPLSQTLTGKVSKEFYPGEIEPVSEALRRIYLVGEKSQDFNMQLYLIKTSLTIIEQ
jgi:hypothetical protein